MHLTHESMTKKKNKLKAVVTEVTLQERRYELMMVLSPALTEKKRQDAYDQVLKLITDNGGKIQAEHDLGKRELSYIIAGQEEAYYVSVYFSNENPTTLDILDRHFRFSKEIIRSLVIKRESAYQHMDISTDYDQDKETSRREKVLKSTIDYKNVTLLRNYVSRYARIVPRYYTKVSLKQQKSLSQAIKQSRHMALMPFVS